MSKSFMQAPNESAIIANDSLHEQVMAAPYIPKDEGNSDLEEMLNLEMEDKSNGPQFNRDDMFK